MPASVRPDSLLVKFLFTAPCLLAMLTITCQLEPEPESSLPPDNGPATGTQPAAATNPA